MIKKILICVLCLLLAGCTAIKENNAKVEVINPPDPSNAGAHTNGSFKASLYFLNEDEKKLVADLRTIYLNKDENPPEAVIKELIRGQLTEGQKKVIEDGIKLERVEVSDEVADIYINTNKLKLSEKEMFIFKVAAANTLIDLLDVDYVNVFWDGMQKSTNGLPSGPQVKTNSDIEDAWNNEEKQKSAQSNTAAYEGKAVLYFGAKDGDFILPEVRNIAFSNDDAVNKVIELLIGGSRLADQRNVLFSKDVKLLNSDFMLENGQKTLHLHFAKLNRLSELGDMQSEILSYASLIYTLTGILPDIETVKIDIQGEEVKSVGSLNFEKGMRRSDFSGMLGKSIPLYMLQKDSSLLTCINRTVTQSKQWDALNRLKELFAGPKENDPSYAWPILPAGVDQNDIIDVSSDKDMIFINLSENFKNKCRDLSEENERMLVYGIVNTLTEISGIKQVQFKIAGKEIDTLSGRLYLKLPLVKNPGIVKTGI